MSILVASTALSAQTATDDQLLVWLNRIAQKQLDAREQEIAGIQNVGQAKQRQAQVRQKLLDAIGGLPESKGPLRARTTGVLRSETHSIEKVIFESLPGVYVTANLFRPNAPGVYPAVLIPAGHTQEGKPEAQLIAANLAAKGFIALTYDPIGQGEREQTYLPQLGRALAGGGGNEHLELGARSILIGQSAARYFIFDGIRAIDYLVSRKDVDPQRLGVTGCSGGGATSTYAAVFDPRIKAAASGCFINTFRTLFTGPTPDTEMSLPQFLARGLDLADYFELAAPLPYLLMATTEDYFTPASARPVYEESRRWYRLFGAEDKIAYFVGNGPHGTPKESREAIYSWMFRWLKGKPGEVAEQPVHLYTNLELRVTASGNVQDEPGNRKLWQVIADEYRANKKPKTADALLAELNKLGVRPSPAAPKVNSSLLENTNDYRLEQLRWESEPGIILEAKLYVPKRAGKRPAVILTEEKRLPVPLYVQRSQSTAAMAVAMANAGQVVLEMEPRDSPAAVDGRPFIGNWLTNERADLVGRNLAAMRASDILTGVAVLAGREDVETSSISGYARGVKAFWMLMAAAMDRRIGKVWLDRAPVSYGSGLEAPLTNNLFEVMIPSFAMHWDISDLRAAMGTRRIFATDPVDWMNQILAAGPGYRYRLVGEGDAAVLEEFLK